MSRRSVERDKAFDIYKEHNGKITNRKIAELLSTSEKNVSEKTVGGWKTKDSWVKKLDGVLHENKRSTPSEEVEYSERKSKGGAPKGNQNAIGNSGNKNPKYGNKNAVGHGAPAGNDNAVKHGLFRKIIPQDDEKAVELLEEIENEDPLAMLFNMIRLKYFNILNSQRIMHVRSEKDKTKELSKVKYYLKFEKTEDGEYIEEIPVEKQWDVQQAWDKQANLLNSLSRAMNTLTSMIARFDKLAHADDKRRLELEQMKATLEKTKADTARIKGEDGDEYEDDGFKEALEGKVEEVWDDHDDNSET
ncbi:MULTISPECIES: phage terminase small subunit [Bacillales]|uniref:phage terminase small subunit n=1 Tax=Bacillales TaxID=1385 RepID=UPI001909EF96|nr:phage terminase small subunit [Staphylococcus aureus]MBK3312603.1 terminase [Staphylococcus aureus]WAI29914.1 MAG: phage terminase small subunit [Bacillus paranthracis]WAI35771.1 MAG: phage terminase small subunit [Bacillus paranthracis]WAI41558.1 MAG: phage terminase small subunit [Bacillus paranthracis]